MANIIRLGGSSATSDPSKNPFMNGDITFGGQWNVGYEIYDKKLYAEAIFTTSGVLTINKAYAVDVWGIGGGGGIAKGKTSGLTYYYEGHGGSGYTNMLLDVNIPIGSMAVTIGASGTSVINGAVKSPYSYLNTTDGGETKLGELFTANGGGRGLSNGNGSYSGGNGGSNGGAVNQNTIKTYGGENGTPGEGFIMSKFRSAEHNTDYGLKDGASAGGWGLHSSTVVASSTYSTVIILNNSQLGYGGTATSGALVMRILLE